MNNCESEEIVEAANIAISNLLPTKSRSLYDIAYNRFKKWCAEKNVQVYSKNVLLAYFSEKPVTDIKRKKSKILTKSEIDRFLSSADDKEFLMIKVGLILGIAGACRTDELVNLTVDDIEDIPRIFVVTDVGNMLELFRKYLSLRPPHVKHKRLFLYYKAGKCSSQPVGKNTMGKIPSVVASYLKLPDVACYTGHCLRRSSATLLADAGVDITTIKRHSGWKSTTVAEGYVENSIENKTKIANQVLVVGRDCGGCKYCNKQFTAYEVKIFIRYSLQSNRFKKWCAEKNVQVYSENVLLAYFSENAKNYKSSTLWAQYSMVKSCLIIYDNIDISKFPKLIAFLKRTGDGYQAKKE
ncbi:hypothetical protein NQ317_006412 [Molorchus minor]|uniref:Tyr recombinase domain-containing protein n=1 Tax=Molorchus minor TaxID=1323400 RepID=A0ABQ9IUY9_9CUCU|nr:hypothetical protein NQ317_006412 [Molorchus minor]